MELSRSWTPSWIPYLEVLYLSGNENRTHKSWATFIWGFILFSSMGFYSILFCFLGFVLDNILFEYSRHIVDWYSDLTHVNVVLKQVQIASLLLPKLNKNLSYFKLSWKYVLIKELLKVSYINMAWKKIITTIKSS